MISEYWLANMRVKSIFFAIPVAIIAIFGFAVISLLPTQVAEGDISNFNVSASPTTGDAPLTVSFGVTFSGDMKSIDWHFGDGTPDTTNVASTSHTYESAGNYTGTVEVVTQDGQSQSGSFVISVSGTIGATTGLPNPRGNETNAYQLLRQEHNNTLVATSQPPLAVTTNSLSYGQGDTVVIHGAVKDVSNATAVTLRLVNPVKNLIAVAQLIPGSDGSFSKTILATGPLWTTAGNYTVIAQYGPYTNASSIFYFSGGNGESIINKLENGTYALQAGQVMYNIPYTIQGGTIKSMQVIPSQSSLVITIDSTSDGSLSVTLPRELIDSKQLPPSATGANQTMMTQFNQAELPDQPFIVQINGQNIKHSETSTSSSRTIGTSFHKGDSTIYVIGTIAVPEFGPIAALVLAIAIISIIAVSAKTGLRFVPRFYTSS